jgi:hypothetical protein
MQDEVLCPVRFAIMKGRQASRPNRLDKQTDIRQENMELEPEIYKVTLLCRTYIIEFNETIKRKLEKDQRPEF